MHYDTRLQQQVKHLEAKLEGRDRAFRSIIQSRFDKDAGGHRVAYRQAIEEFDRMMTAYKNFEADCGECESVCTGCGWPIDGDGPSTTVDAFGGQGSGEFCDVGCVEEFGFAVVDGEYVMTR